MEILHKIYTGHFTVPTKFEKALYFRGILYYNVTSEKMRYSWRKFTPFHYRPYNFDETSLKSAQNGSCGTGAVILFDDSREDLPYLLPAIIRYERDLY